MARLERRNYRFLLQDKYKEATRRVYTKEALKFIAWVEKIGERATTAADLDELMCDYVHRLYLLRPTASPVRAVYTRYGMTMLLPEYAKDGFPLTDRTIAGWRARRPSTPWPPISWNITVLIACTMSRLGHYRAGVAVLLAFHCYLRASEVVALRREDIALPGDLRLAAVGAARDIGVLRLRHTKTGTEQSVTITDKTINTLLRTVYETTVPGQFIFPFSTQSLRTWFREACHQVGLDHCGFVLHSLRHGGATRDFVSGVSIEDILVRGRWQSNKTSRRYIQSGRALMMAVQIPLKLQILAARMALDPADSMLQCTRAFSRHAVITL